MNRLRKLAESKPENERVEWLLNAASNWVIFDYFKMLFGAGINEWI